MEAGLRKIDALTAGDHSFINENSGCFYFLEYPSGSPEINRGNEIYSYVHNFKKSLDRKGTPQWKYKIKAINETIELLNSFFIRSGKLGEHTLVPIPPSKTKSHPLYDDRMSMVLLELKNRYPGLADVREILTCRNDMNASHESTVRPSIQDLQDNYEVDELLLSGSRPSIILFDDVLTTGAHYVAAQNKILERRPDATIRGIFIARRVLPEPDPFDDFDFSTLFK